MRELSSHLHNLFLKLRLRQSNFVVYNSSDSLAVMVLWFAGNLRMPESILARNNVYYTMQVQCIISTMVSRQ